MSKSNQPAFVCPDGHDVIDKEKSNENWIVTTNPCPVCGKQLVFKMQDKNDDQG